MKTARLIAAALAVALPCILLPGSLRGGMDTPSYGSPDLKRITSRQFGFSVSVPGKWQKEEFNLQYKQVVSLSGPGGAFVKITATVNDDEERENWTRWKDWYEDSPVNGINTIIEQKTMKYDKSGQGTLYVFEARRGSRTMLMRLLLVTLEKSLIAIECGAPVSEFYKNTWAFDAVMSSLKINVTEGK